MSDFVNKYIIIDPEEGIFGQNLADLHNTQVILRRRYFSEK